MERCAAAHHGVEDNLAFKPPWRVVLAQGWIIDKLLEDMAKCGSGAPRPPLVQVRIRAEQVLVEGLVRSESVRFSDRKSVIQGNVQPGLYGGSAMRFAEIKPKLLH